MKPGLKFCWKVTFLTDFMAQFCLKSDLKSGLVIFLTHFWPILIENLRYFDKFFAQFCHENHIWNLKFCEFSTKIWLIFFTKPYSSSAILTIFDRILAHFCYETNQNNNRALLSRLTFTAVRLSPICPSANHSLPARRHLEISPRNKGKNLTGRLKTMLKITWMLIWWFGNVGLDLALIFRYFGCDFRVKVRRNCPFGCRRRRLPALSRRHFDDD